MTGLNAEREERGGVSHSLSMRGAEIALKMTSCRVMVVVCWTGFQPRLDVESITLLQCAVLYHLWVSRSLHTAVPHNLVKLCK